MRSLLRWLLAALVASSVEPLAAQEGPQVRHWVEAHPIDPIVQFIKVYNPHPYAIQVTHLVVHDCVEVWLGCGESGTRIIVHPGGTGSAHQVTGLEAVPGFKYQIQWDRAYPVRELAPAPQQPSQGTSGPRETPRYTTAVDQSGDFLTGAQAQAAQRRPSQPTPPTTQPQPDSLEARGREQEAALEAQQRQAAAAEAERRSQEEAVRVAQQQQAQQQRAAAARRAREAALASARRRAQAIVEQSRRSQDAVDAAFNSLAGLFAARAAEGQAELVRDSDRYEEDDRERFIEEMEGARDSRHMLSILEDRLYDLEDEADYAEEQAYDAEESADDARRDAEFYQQYGNQAQITLLMGQAGGYDARARAEHARAARLREERDVLARNLPELEAAADAELEAELEEEEATSLSLRADHGTQPGLIRADAVPSGEPNVGGSGRGSAVAATGPDVGGCTEASDAVEPGDEIYEIRRLNASPHDRDVLYGATIYPRPRPFNCRANGALLRSEDAGETWNAISPMLAMRPPSSDWFFSNVTAASESRLQPGIIWVGTNDALVYITRDDGESWTDVTPAQLPASAVVREVEALWNSPGAAYIIAAIGGSRVERMYVFRTTDYGVSWTWTYLDLSDL